MLLNIANLAIIFRQGMAKHVRRRQFGRGYVGRNQSTVVPGQIGMYFNTSIQISASLYVLGSHVYPHFRIIPAFSTYRYKLLPS